jgi:hypothetical protein
MITITLRPLHLAIAAGFLAGIIVAVVVVLASGGDDDSSPEAANLNPTAAASPTATTAPTETAVPEPSATPEPQPSPQPEPSATPVIRSCDEIRADPVYRSPEERQFFLDNCLGETQASQPAPSQEPAPSSNSSEATTAEALYRDRAEGSMVIFVAKLTQYFSTPALGTVGDLLDFGAVLRRQAQEMDLLPTPPPRFEQAHNQLRASLLAFADYLLTIVNVHNQAEYDVWLVPYFDFFDAMISAIDDYALVVGFDLPPELAP